MTARAVLISPQNYADFILHPFSVWIKDTFGSEERDGRLVRQQPRSTKSATEDLHGKTGVERETCAAYLQSWLLARYSCEPDLETGQ